MKFPLSEINRQEYLDHIYELIKDDGCQIFVDTNIFALFYRINNSARTEFFDWLEILIDKKRVKTPVWALNEYTNRFIRNKIEDYFGPLKKVKSIQNDFQELSSFLKMNIDTPTINGSHYGSLEDFNDDLDIIEKKLRYIKQTAKSKDETYKLKIHNEIKSLFENTILPSKLNEILDITRLNGKFRYEHKLPPGFQDDNKELNSFGDLIIWNEIINYCEAENIEKGILITNDLKKDWVYPPYNLRENCRVVSNRNDQFKIIDPRLVFEFKQKTNSEEFHIISFETLTQILLHNTNGKFIELAKALQLDHIKQNEVEEEEKDRTDENPEEQIVEIPAREQQNEDLNPEDIEGQFQYDANALADQNFPLNDKSFLTNTIIDLKSYNWYVQNPALDKFEEYHEDKIEHINENSNKLFVIGRNIYQSAQGGSASAVYYMNNLRAIFTKFSNFYINHIFSGMLYEIYFDSKNEFREYNFKTSFLDVVYSLESLDRLESSFYFINQVLQPFSEHLLYLPNGDNITMEITLSDEPELGKTFLNEDVEIFNISQINANGTSLLTNNMNQIIKTEHYYFYDLKIEGLLKLIGRVYAIPSCKIETVRDLDENINMEFTNQKLKILG